MNDINLMRMIEWDEATNDDVGKFFGIERTFGWLAGKRSPEKFYHSYPDYLGSVDAALSLVPDTFDYYIEKSSPSGNWRFYWNAGDNKFEMLSGISKSPAVSIVKAMIVMKEISNEQE